MVKGVSGDTVKVLKRMEKFLSVCKYEHLTVAEISEKADIPIASAYNMGKALAFIGWVEQISKLSNAGKRAKAYKALKIIKWRNV